MTEVLFALNQDVDKEVLVTKKELVPFTFIYAFYPDLNGKIGSNYEKGIYLGNDYILTKQLSIKKLDQDIRVSDQALFQVLGNIHTDIDIYEKPGYHFGSPSKLLVNTIFRIEDQLYIKIVDTNDYGFKYLNLTGDHKLNSLEDLKGYNADESYTGKVTFSVKDSVSKDYTVSIKKYISVYEALNAESVSIPLIDPDEVIKIESITFNATATEIPLGTTKQLSYTISPEDATNTKVLLTSNSIDKFTIDENALLTNVNYGKATINVTTNDGGLTDSLNFTCTPPSVESAKFTEKNVISGVGVSGLKVSAFIDTNELSSETVYDNKFNIILNKDYKNGETIKIIQSTNDNVISSPFTLKSRIAVKSIETNVSQILGEIGNTGVITLKVSPTTATDKSGIWYSSNNEVVVINSDGTYELTGKGEANLTYISNSDADIFSQINVKVKVYVVSISLDNDLITTEIGTTGKLNATVLPENANDLEISWVSSSPSVVKVDQYGNWETVSKGEATITATTTDGQHKATANFNVIVKLNGIVITGADDLVINKSTTFNVTYSPSNANNTNVTWSSSNNKIATVDNKGNVTGVAEGSVTITAIAEDGNFRATKDISIKSDFVAVTSLQIFNPTTIIELDKTYQLSTEISPSNATDKTVTYSSSNNKIATVDSKGLITAVSEGDVVISVISSNSSIKDTMNVNIRVSVTGVTVSPTSVEIAVEETSELNITVAPENATNKDGVWTASDESIATVINGVVTGVAEGDVDITFTTADGQFKAVCKVTVKAATVAEETTE